MGQAEGVIDRAGCPTNAIFVTLSTQAERAACIEACPRERRGRVFEGRRGAICFTLCLACAATH